MWTLFWLAVLAAVAGAWAWMTRAERPKDWAEDAQSKENLQAFRDRVVACDWGHGKDWGARVVCHREPNGTVIVDSVEQFPPGTNPTDLPYGVPCNDPTCTLCLAILKNHDIPAPGV